MTMPIRGRARWAALALALALLLPAAANAQNAYITNGYDGTVSVIDTASNTVATIPVGNSGSGPYGVAVTPDGTKVYVTHLAPTSAVSVIATATNIVVATIPVGNVGNNSIGVAVTPDGTNAYVTNQNSSTVSVIATATNTVTTTIPVDSGPNGVAITPDGTKVYITHYAPTSTVSVIATATNTVVATIPVGNVGNNPYGVAVTPDGTKVYVANGTDATVSVIDTATNTVTTTIPGVDNPYGVAITPDGTKVYVATNRNPGTVSVIDTATNTVVGAPIPVGLEPVGVAITPDGTKVYVANFSSGTVSVIATASNTVVATIPVGRGPAAFGKFIGGPLSTCKQITTAQDLQNIGTNAATLSGNYCLANDIDASITATWNGGAGFVPIGDDVNQFNGTFDGQGHTISNLTMRSPKVYVGLFGYVGVNRTIANVNITNSNPVYTGPASTGVIGVLAGANAGRIINCHTSGSLVSYGVTFGGLVGFNDIPGIVSRSSSTVNIAPPEVFEFSLPAGGLVGFNGGGVISDSHASGAVSGITGTSGAFYLGGLVGFDFHNGLIANKVTIDRSWASGSVTGTGPGIVEAGGLVGHHQGEGAYHYIIRGSSATGDVSSTGVAGGLVGINSSGDVVTSYATGNVTGTNGPVGGLIGHSLYSGQVDQTYAIGRVSGPIAVNLTGGLVGRNDGTTFANSYWDTQTTGQTSSAAGIGQTTAQLKAGLPSGFDPTVWGIVPSITYPYLLWQTVPPVISSVSPNPVTGSGSAQPFTINGNNFVSGANVTLQDLTAGQTFPNRLASSFSSTQIVINPIFTTAAHSWSVEVINPSGQTSGQFPFMVIAPVAPPVAVPETASTPAGTPVTIDLTAGASGNPTSAAHVGTPVGGTVTGFPATTVTFTPTTGFSGAASFQFTLANAGGTSNTAIATITVTPGPAPTISSVSPNPVTGSNSAQPFTINGTNFVSGANVTLRDLTAVPVQVFPNRPASSFSSTQIVINPIFTTAAHSWSVEVINSDGQSSGQFLFPVIAPLGVPPTAAPQNPPAVTVGTPVTINLSKGSTGNPTSATIVSQPALGTAKIVSGTTKVVYTQKACFTGTDTFTFTLTNAFGTSTAQTVTVTFNPVSNPITTVHLVDPYLLKVSLANITEASVYSVSDRPTVQAQGLLDDNTSAAIAVVKTNDCANAVSLTTTNGTTLADYSPDFLTKPPTLALPSLSIPVSKFQYSTGFFFAAALVQAPAVGATYSLSTLTSANPITVTAFQGSTQKEATMSLVIPPVVLVHGIWGDRTALKFYENSLGALDPWKLYLSASGINLGIRPIQYQNDIAFDRPIDDPEYPNTGTATLNKIITSSWARLDTLQFVGGRVDVVAHSMGGLVARALAGQQAYSASIPGPGQQAYIASLRGRAQGTIHQIITIDTPENGTALAKFLLDHQSDTYRNH